MKLLQTIFVTLWITLCIAHGSDEFSKPFEGLTFSNVSKIEIAIKDIDKPVHIVDAATIKGFLNLVTPLDYPKTDAPMAFSLPGKVAVLTLFNSDNKEQLKIDLYGAWNLMATGKAGSYVLGSNRRQAEFIIQQIEKHHPKKVEEWRGLYKGKFSGSYPKEYHETID